MSTPAWEQEVDVLVVGAGAGGMAAALTSGKVADLIMRLDEHWSVLLERGTDLVVTTGMLSTNAAEHATSRIPGHVKFSFEVRSKSIDTLEAFYQLMRAECTAIGRERQVRFEFDRRILAKDQPFQRRVQILQHRRIVL